MKEGLYIDVVSKTIISQLAESIAQFVGDSVSEEIKKVLLTKLPGVIGDKIAPVVNNARKDVQKATEKSGKRVLDQLKDIKGRVDKSVQVQKELLDGTLQRYLKEIATDLTAELDIMHEVIEKKALDIEGIAKKIIAGSNKEIQKHILSNSEKTDKALNNLESFIKTELIQIQETLAGSLGKKHYDLHDKIINSIQKLVQDRPETKVDVEKLQSQSKKVIDVLDARIRDLENEKVELVSALNESIASAKNLRVFSQKEIDELKSRIDELKSKIDELESEKAGQELYITRNFARINASKNQIDALSKKLTESELIVENATKEKAVIEKKLTVIQELWEKQQMRQ